MPIDDFEHDTFVAFADISGFKQLVRQGDPAKLALNHFYKAGYGILGSSSTLPRRPVEGLFVSDCAVLFSTKTDDPIECLWSLLSQVGLLNRRMLEGDYMLTTSIAYGRFRYSSCIEFRGIEKNQLSGHAYLDAFLDKERGRPKLSPGQVRICRDGLPEPVKEALGQRSSPFERVEETPKHFYYYWMVNDPHDIAPFKDAYSNAHDLKYRGFLHALRRARDGVQSPAVE